MIIIKIKDLPLEYRPREKALKYGFEFLSDIELVAIILRTGTRDCNVIQLASNVLAEVGGLSGLLSSSYQSLKKINGIKTAKALSLASLITIYQRAEMAPKYDHMTIEKILFKYERKILTEKQEKTVVVIVDRNKQIIKESLIGVGTDSGVGFSYRELFKEIYLNNGYSFYLIHTHPNSAAFPSNGDIKLTEAIRKRSVKLGLHFIEHYIVGTDGSTGIYDFLKKNMN